jgi:hypothetical protein
MIGGCKYRPLTEGLNWIASRIQRRNPRRDRPRKASVPTNGSQKSAARKL